VPDHSGEAVIAQLALAGVGVPVPVAGEGDSGVVEVHEADAVQELSLAQLGYEGLQSGGAMDGVSGGEQVGGVEAEA